MLPTPDEGLHRTVARFAARRPDASALITGTGRTTYRELDRTANAWAEVLLNRENLIGATENGRPAITGGARVFAEPPEQWRRLRANRSLLPSAVEEIPRWTSSATHSMRTLTEPVEIRGRRMDAGDRVGNAVGGPRTLPLRLGR